MFSKDSKFPIQRFRDCLQSLISLFRLSCLTSFIPSSIQQFKINEENINKDKSNIQNQNLIGKEISFSGYNGIISELRKIDINSVVVTCSSVYHIFQCQTVLNHDDYSYFASQDLENSWICFEFVNKKVLLSSYLLRHYLYDWNYLRNWKVEVSNDNVQWFQIDQKKNDQSFTKPLEEVRFQCQPSSPSSFIKITQIEKTSNNNFFLNLNFVEFAGKIFEK